MWTYAVFVRRFTIMLVQHFWVYLPVSILTGWHVQYMCHPPKQLRHVGENYRLTMTAGVWGATWLTHTVTMMLSAQLNRDVSLMDLAGASALLFAIGMVLLAPRKSDGHAHY